MITVQLRTVTGGHQYKIDQSDYRKLTLYIPRKLAVIHSLDEERSIRK